MSRTSLVASLLLLLGACSGQDVEPAGGGLEAAAPSSATPAAAATDSASLDSANPAAATDPAHWQVSEEGIGPLRAGMTRARVEQIIGAELAMPAGSAGSCAMAPIPGAATGTVVMVVGDTLVRVDVFGSSTTATTAGAKIGDASDRIQSLYPGRVKREPHKYDAGQYLVVPSVSDTTYQLRFETDEQGKVTRYRSGRLPEVGWVEACG